MTGRLPSSNTYKLFLANLHFGGFQPMGSFLFNLFPSVLPAILTLGLLEKTEARLFCQSNFPKFPFFGGEN
jgi:hypothetical protein